MDDFTEIRQVIENKLVKEDFELVDWKFAPRASGSSLVLLVDHPRGGITMAECAQINREISLLLDGIPAWPKLYSLEVNSPGLDRPLKTQRDFVRVQGKRICVMTREKLQGGVSHIGVLERVGPEGIRLKRLSDSQSIDIPFSVMVSSKLNVTLSV